MLAVRFCCVLLWAVASDCVWPSVAVVDMFSRGFVFGVAASAAVVCVTRMLKNRQKNRRKRVYVSGCFDLLHSGHVAFFKEAAALGQLYVSVGNDANITGLKAAPMFPDLVFFLFTSTTLKEGY